MDKIIIHLWNNSKDINKTYQYERTDIKNFLNSILERDKNKGFFRHYDIMSTCGKINIKEAIDDIIRYTDGIRLCDNNNNFKTIKIQKQNKDYRGYKVPDIKTTNSDCDCCAWFSNFGCTKIVKERGFMKGIIYASYYKTKDNCNYFELGQPRYLIVKPATGKR